MNMILPLVLLIVIALSLVLIHCEFWTILFFNKSIVSPAPLVLVQCLTLVLWPTIYFSFMFSPLDFANVSLYCCILTSLIAYAYSVIRANLDNPISEVLVNMFLLLGVLINVVLGLADHYIFFIFGHLPIIQLFLIQIIKNHRIHLAKIQDDHNGLEDIVSLSFWFLLQSRPLFKFTSLTVLTLPLLLSGYIFSEVFQYPPDIIWQGIHQFIN